MFDQYSARWRPALCAVAVGFALLQFPATSYAGPLDKYSAAQLRGWFLAELNDIFRRRPMVPNEEYDIDDLVDAIMEELEDRAADDPRHTPANRQAHAILTLDALEEEMDEADTTLEREVRAAVVEADRRASRDRSGTRNVAHVNGFAQVALPESRDRPEGLLVFGPRDGKPPAGISMQFVADRLTNTIKVCTSKPCRR